MTEATRGPLVLAIADPGLRSLLAARLCMAGETPILTTDHLDPALSQEIRATALLIIEELLIASPSVLWSQALRSQFWTEQIIVIVDTLLGNAHHDDAIMLVDRRNVGVAIPALVQLWQAGAGQQVSSLG